MRISFVGDISLFRIDVSSFRISESCLDLFKSSDLVVGNLECPLTAYADKTDQAYSMSATPNSISLLNKFDILSLANNHIRDFGVRGLNDTIEVLRASKILHFGSGNTRREALKPQKLNLNGYKISLIGATRFANATKENGGGTARDNDKLMFQEIRELKKAGFFVVVYMHWGYEYVRIPSPRDRKIAHRCLDSGADLIIGSHPHVYQGIEDYKGKKIIYSLGNFIFHSSVFDELAPIPGDPRLNESYLISIELNRDNTYNVDIYGYQTDDYGVQCYDSIRNIELIKEVRSISRVFEQNFVQYLRAYYLQTIEISDQNDKIRTKLQHYNKLSFLQKLAVYKNANHQDFLNKAVGTFLRSLQIKR